LLIIFNLLTKNKSKSGDGIVYKEQKRLIKNINGCCEHPARINFIITHAINYMKIMYIASLDCKDAFGSVSHQLLNSNLKNLGIPRRLRTLIMDSYNRSQVRIWSAGEASRPIAIKKGI
jgi:hypothetical protein